MPFESFEFNPEFASPQDWAAMYRGHCGWQAVPALMPSEDVNWKRPVTPWREFEDKLVPQAIFDRWYGPKGQYRSRSNMVIITGAASGVFVVDLDMDDDDKDGFAWWRGLLAAENNDMEPETPSQRTGGGGRQLVFRIPAGWTPPTFKTRIGVDIRGQGGVFVCPPSMHHSGQEYVWEPGREPWNLEVAEAPPWLIAAIEALRLEYSPHAGEGQQRVASPEDKNAFGLTVDGREQRMANIVWGVACDLRREFPTATTPDDPKVALEKERAWGLYLFEVKTRIQQPGLANEAGLEMEGRGRTAFEERWRRALDQWNGKLREEAARPKPTPHPKPEEVGDFDPWAELEPPAFPLACLPTAQQAYVEQQAISIGCDPAGIAMAMLTVMSGALDQRHLLKMRRSGDWYVPPRMWTVLIGEASTKKSPIINTAVKPLRRIERDYAAQQRRDMAVWESAEKEDRGEKPAHATRFILNDTTVEAAGQIMGRQDRGLLVVHDELSGFVGSMDRYSHGSGDRAFWLTSYNGGPMIVDRIGRSIVIENLCVAFLAGMQPDRIQGLSDLVGDGLLQRYNPIVIGRGPMSSEVESDLADLRYGDQIKFLIAMRPQTHQMTAAGLVEAEAFRRGIYDLEGERFLGAGFSTWVGKLAGTHGSLSLLLHVLETRDDAPFLQIGETTVRNASAILFDFIIPHGRIFYEKTLSTEATENLRTLGSYILTSDQDRFRVSDFRSRMPALRDTKTLWEMNSLMAPFVTAGWLVEDGQAAWNITSGLRDRFADRRQIELKRKAAFLKRFKANGQEHEQPSL